MKRNKNLQKLYPRMNSWVNIIFCGTLMFQNITCINPVTPEFDIIENLVIIDGIASSIPGASYVSLSTSGNINTPINDATVWFINSNTEDIVNLTLIDGVYVPPVDFVTQIGDSWQMKAILPNGKHYESTSETVLKPIPINNASVSYNRELYYNNSLERFIPGHSIVADIDDPVGEDNFYYWDYRSYEKLRVCHQCIGTDVFRNGECVENPLGLKVEPGGVNDFNFSYICNTSCWTIRYNNRIKIFSDKFSNGTKTKGLTIAEVPLDTKEDIVVEVQQFSVSQSAYKYYKVLKDLLENNSSLNAPPASILIGNLFNPDDDDEYVLGRFTTTSGSAISLFIDRNHIIEEPIIERSFIRTEIPKFVCLEGSLCVVLTADCIESRFRTGIEPEGWIEQ